MKSELDQQFWAIITAKEIVCMNKTYEQCQMILDQQNLNANEATIVTNATAAKMMQGIINKREGSKNDTATRTD